MKKAPKVSVIVPIYNVEKYLVQCLESIVNQTLTDIEIICINDGATDSCRKIIESYARIDSRIIAINNPNQGYAKSVNWGIKNAKGDYISIIESDDFIEPEMLEDLYNMVFSNKCDLSKCNFYNYWTKNNIDKISRTSFSEYKNKVFNLKDFPKVLKSHPSVWAALYKKDFLINNDIFFTESTDSAFLDILFTFKALINAQRIIVTDKPYLHYRQDNANSTVNNAYKIYCISDEYDLLTAYLNERPDIKNYINKYKLLKQYRDYKWNFARISSEYKKNFLEKFQVTFMELNKREVLRNELPFSEYKQVKLLISNPDLYLKKYGNSRISLIKKILNVRINRQEINICILGKSIFQRSFNYERN